MKQEEVDTIINSYKTSEIKQAEDSLREKINQSVRLNCDNINLTYSEKNILVKNNILEFNHLIRDNNSLGCDGHTLYFRHIDKILEIEKKEHRLCIKIICGIAVFIGGIVSLYYI